MRYRVTIMNPETQDIVDQNKNINYQYNRPKSSSKLLSILLILILLTGSTTGVWFYQQAKINDLQKSVANITTEKQKTSDELTALNQKINAEKQNKIVTTYTGVISDTDDRYGSSSGLHNGNADIIIVQFTAENKGTATQTLKVSDFDLKT